jgi:hypothetical protein
MPILRIIYFLDYSKATLAYKATSLLSEHSQLATQMDKSFLIC